MINNLCADGTVCDALQSIELLILHLIAYGNVSIVTIRMFR